MGLINLLTDPKNFKFYNGGQGYTGNGTQPSLTNIPYGKDQIGGGSSGQPYIQIPIQQKTTNLGLANSDFILRGGALSTENAAYDALRLTKMFGDTKSPNGILFIAKQQLLSRTAVRTQTSGVLNEGGYNPLGTLAQAGIVNIGGHLNKQGDILGETGAYSNNSNLYGVRIKPTQPSDENRLVTLYTDTTTNSTTNNFGFVKGVSINPDARIAGNSVPVLMSYSGGPGSTLGVGKTNIRFADQRTGKNNLQYNTPYFRGFYNQVAINPNQTGPVILHDISDIPVYISSSKFIATTASQYTISSNATSKGTGVNNPLAVTNPTYFFGTYKKIIKPDYTKTLFYNTAISENKGVTGQYYRLTNVFPVTNINPLGTSTDNYNVYLSGSLKNAPLINAQGTYTYTQEDLVKTPNNPGKLSFSPKIQDFREELKSIRTSNQSIDTDTAKQSGQLTTAPDYADFNIEKRVNIGNKDGSGPGARSGKNYANYTAGVTYLNGGGNVGPLDRINALPIYKSENVTTDSVKNDLIKFRIAIIDNDTPTSKTFVHFRAFLDSISDAYTAEWNSVKYLGRGENFYTYGGYTRQMSLSWTVAAQSKQELIPMYKKLNYLASSLTPSYSTLGYMRGNMVQLTIGGYVYEQPGIITGLTYTLEADTTWEIGINTEGGSDSDVKELPHIIRVTGFNFIPIQKFRPEIQKDEDDYKHYISLADGSGEADNSYGSLPPKVSTTISQTPKTDTDLKGTGALIRNPAEFVGPKQPKNEFVDKFVNGFTGG